MTLRRTNTSWRDALFNALRATHDGVAGFCNWASAHRDRTIADSTLYKRLDGKYPGERVPIEDAELITEYVMRDANARHKALDWIAALAARWNLIVIAVDPPRPVGDLAADLRAIVDKVARFFEKGGRLAGVVNQATADGHLTGAEVDEIEEHIDLVVRHLMQMKVKVRRAAGRPVDPSGELSRADEAHHAAPTQAQEDPDE
ncbi:hypothetical protein FOZ76_14575 [Verticiella sediminum]|uniref:Uncharacterized protein n=1 Tax=Verticiella sediminum TaxID=1247510 RepID=A0A556AIC9_9BURK|nr:phage regulatory CII family protein [Verticiella sediminum]TSH92642.1 hypothetical protein FOZ76_14575 [Verticiella sediminum]